uniref:Uncharacterized protein MANES_18G119700 n=1 Tax=Rhizophora mucronata TaxID=61149 RepID=A0A2P2L466_RHIMU
MHASQALWCFHLTTRIRQVCTQSKLSCVLMGPVNQCISAGMMTQNKRLQIPFSNGRIRSTKLLLAANHLNFIEVLKRLIDPVMHQTII